VIITDEMIDEVVERSIRANGGCCGGPEWRGRLCDYHRGYEDGLDVARSMWLGEPDDPRAIIVTDRAHERQERLRRLARGDQV